MTEDDKALVEAMKDAVLHGAGFIKNGKYIPIDDVYIDPRDARIEALSAEIERLREALRPFALAAEKGFNVYVGVAQAMADSPHLFSYSTAYIDAGRSAAHSHISWIDYEEARAALEARHD